MKKWKHCYHCHSLYSDGNNSFPEMVSAAKKANLITFGISDHSPVPIESDWNMKKELFEQYILEIDQHNKKESNLEIFKGMELDYLRGAPHIDLEYFNQLDYTVGSLHYLALTKNPTGIDPQNWEILDYSTQRFEKLFFNYFSGNVSLLAKEYTAQLSEMMELYHPTILGHIDLICKFNQKKVFFDEEDNKWLYPFFDVLELAKEKDIIVEINTGAISRGYRTVPYPAPAIIKRCAERNIMMTLNSDAHSTNGIVTAFDSALELAKICGIKELWRLRRDNKITWGAETID